MPFTINPTRIRCQSPRRLLCLLKAYNNAVPPRLRIKPDDVVDASGFRHGCTVDSLTKALDTKGVRLESLPVQWEGDTFVGPDLDLAQSYLFVGYSILKGHCKGYKRFLSEGYTHACALRGGKWIDDEYKDKIDMTPDDEPCPPSYFTPEAIYLVHVSGK